MSLSQHDIEKIYQIKQKLLTTFKVTTSAEQKKRIKSYLAHIESILDDIERGLDVDPEKLNIFSSEFKNTEDIEENFITNYSARIEIIKLNENIKDKEMDLIYSFFIFFENNFFNIFTPKYLKLDYQFNKKRDLLFAQYDAFKILLKQYKDDLDLLSELRVKAQIEQFKKRIDQQKKYLLVKLSELIHGFRDFTLDLLNDIKYGKNGFINFDEVFEVNFENNEFNGWKMGDIIKEAEHFFNEFLDILRMPDFRRSI